MTCSQWPGVRNTAKASARAAHREAHGRPVLLGPCRASIILMMTHLKAQVWGIWPRTSPHLATAFPAPEARACLPAEGEEEPRASMGPGQWL